MSEHLIAVSAVGKDRPGMLAHILDALMRLAVYHDDPKTHLLPGGNTSTLLTIRTEASVDEVRSALVDALPHDELAIDAHELVDHTGDPHPDADRSRYVLRVRTAGRPGVLAAFTTVVSRHGGTVIDFGTRIGGGRVSVLRVEMEEGREPDPVALAGDLYDLAEQLGVGIKFYDTALGEHHPVRRR